MATEPVKTSGIVELLTMMNGAAPELVPCLPGPEQTTCPLGGKSGTCCSDL
jgi:hypothetical protein